MRHRESKLFGELQANSEIRIRISDSVWLVVGYFALLIIEHSVRCCIYLVLFLTIFAVVTQESFFFFLSFHLSDTDIV
jgi:hypothetical protein